MPTLTVMEGREENSGLVEDLKRETEKIGWDFLCLGEINSDKIARVDFDDIALRNVIFRELSGNNYYEVERVLDYVRKQGGVTVNVDIAGGRACTSDKHYQQGLFMLDPFLRKYALPTFEAKFKRNVEAYLLSKRVHYPIVLKPRRGTLGDDIVLVRNEDELKVVKNFGGMLIEQYVEPECDFRVFVIGGKAVGAMRKVGNLENPGDFKAWCSGVTREKEEDEEVLKEINQIACRAAEVSGLDYAGVDIVRGKRDGKYYLLETNIAASWSTFVPVTGINIPRLLVEYVKDRAATLGKSDKV